MKPYDRRSNQRSFIDSSITATQFIGDWVEMTWQVSFTLAGIVHF